jgi:hypothetical protein
MATSSLLAAQLAFVRRRYAPTNEKLTRPAQRVRGGELKKFIFIRLTFPVFEFHNFLYQGSAQLLPGRKSMGAIEYLLEWPNE